MYISDEFTKRENSYCSVSHGSYEHILAAKIDCASDDKCIGIHEAYIDQKIILRLCRNGFVTSYTQKSVIHQKDKNISSQIFLGTNFYSGYRYICTKI